MPRKNGFTLIELLVAVTVIAILSALTLSFLSASRERARQASCTGQLKQIGQSLRIYADDWEAYPPEYLADAMRPSEKGILRCPNDTAEKPSDYKSQAIDNPPDKMTSYVWAGPMLKIWSKGKWMNTEYADRVAYLEANHPNLALVVCEYHGYYHKKGARPMLRLTLAGSVRKDMLPPRDESSLIWDLNESLGWSINALLQ